MKYSYPDIYGAAAAIAAAPAAALGFVAVAAAFLAAIALIGRINGALGHGNAGLRLNLRKHFRDGVLLYGARNYGCRNGWDLHQHPLNNLKTLVTILREKHEQRFNHLV